MYRHHADVPKESPSRRQRRCAARCRHCTQATRQGAVALAFKPFTAAVHSVLLPHSPGNDVQQKQCVIPFSQAKQAIGLEHCKFFLTGAAPISKEVLEYFASIGISINEVPACKRVYPVKRTHNSVHFPPFFRCTGCPSAAAPQPSALTPSTAGAPSGSQWLGVKRACFAPLKAVVAGNWWRASSRGPTGTLRRRSREKFASGLL